MSIWRQKPEVGYVGRDCESMIRDLVEMSVRLVKEEKINGVKEKAKNIVITKLADILEPIKKDDIIKQYGEYLREKLVEKIVSGEYDNEFIEIQVASQPKNIGVISGMGNDMDFSNVLGSIFPQPRKLRKVTVKEAKDMLVQEEADKLIDNENVNSEAIRRAEQEGIIFIDEIDKIAGKGEGKGPDVSREGVQRDILPLVEGSTVNTKYGMIKTDYILFIAAGAFHISKVKDLIPEFQGRFPIRVELQNLTKDDFYRILTQPKNALTMQYQEMLKVDNINLVFTEEALNTIAELCEKENEVSENIGARRLHTILEFLLEDISYNASGNQPMTDVVIDKNYVDKAFSDTSRKYDLKKYIL